MCKYCINWVYVPCEDFFKVEIRSGVTQGGNWQILKFSVRAEHRVKLKESEKKDKYLDLAGELKKNMEYESELNRCAR